MKFVYTLVSSMGAVLKRGRLKRLLLFLFLVVTHSSTKAQEDFWEQTNGPFGGSVLSLAVHADGAIFAGTFNGGVFRSTNHGDSWAEVNSGLSSNFGRLSGSALAINSAGHIFAGVPGGGVFRSTNNGDSWTEVNTGLTDTDILSFAVHANGVILAGTNGSGVFRSIRTTINQPPVRSFVLDQNFPNPFNPTTTIRFGLPSESHVTLKVYNLLGEEVSTLVQGELKFAGYHLVAWDGTDNSGRQVASGVYLYRLRAEGLTITKKMAFLK